MSKDALTRDQSRGRSAGSAVIPPDYQVVESRSNSFTRWAAWRSTLGEWWDSGKVVDVLQPIAGFRGHSVHVAPEVALGDGPTIERVKVPARCRDTGRLYVRGKGIPTPDTPCWCLELTCSERAPTLAAY